MHTDPTDFDKVIAYYRCHTCHKEFMSSYDADYQCNGQDYTMWPEKGKEGLVTRKFDKFVLPIASIFDCMTNAIS